jgi:flavin-dependent dehydrogenase
MYDVAIVGAGPAGATLARLIGNRSRVLLLDRRPLEAPPVAGRSEKCCGGLVSANAQRALDDMGLTVPSEVRVPEQPDAVRVIDADNGVEHCYPRPYINCRRELFDRWLVSLAPGSVDVRCGCAVRALDTDARGTTIGFSAGGRGYTERARVVVGADGATSVVRRLAFPRTATARAYVAVQGWFAPAAPLPAHVAIFDRAVTDYYGWIVPKDGLLAVGAALAPHDDPHAHFARLLASLEDHGVALGPMLWREGAIIRRPMRGSEIRTGDGRVALLGEAAGFISPSSAEGFSYAFRSAMALADALRDGPEGVAARYAALTTPLRQALAREALKCAGMFTPWVRGLAIRADRMADAAGLRPTATAVGH